MCQDQENVLKDPEGELLHGMQSGVEVGAGEIEELGLGEVGTEEKREEEFQEILADLEPKRENIIPALQTVQEKYGYLSGRALKFVAERFDTALARVYGIATFYSQFYLKPQGEHTIKVCNGTACHVKGADDIFETVKDELDIDVGEVTDDGKFALKVVRCLGCCSLAPVIMIDDEVYGNLTDKKVKKVLSGYE